VARITSPIRSSTSALRADFRHRSACSSIRCSVTCAWGGTRLPYTHVDALHQAYFVACLILAEIGTPVNPGNPYIGSQTQHGFGTFGSAQGGPVDAVGTLPEMATRALKAAWFHKWVVNLRQRPAELGALVHARLTNQNPMPQAAAALHHDVLNSAVLPIIHSQYGSYLLPQAFPEGAPTHPCYPTGHGTVEERVSQRSSSSSTATSRSGRCYWPPVPM